MHTLYIEHAVRDHPRTRELIARYDGAYQVGIERYTDVFNAPAQNFRHQKQNPALIIARKHGRRVLPTPPDYHIGGRENFYFSHMLNCIYDCRYCFLQGMYRSANYVLFVNFEDFFDDVAAQAARIDGPSWYFSGYDCDSLALEPVTGFMQACLDHFDTVPNAWLELRTKSTQIRSLLSRPPLPRCVVAYSLSPEAVVTAEEQRTPALHKRIDALRALQAAGWSIGLRFDPILQAANFEELYDELFDRVFAALDTARIHSVSLGTFRLPKPFFRRMISLYPESGLLAADLQNRDGMVTYAPAEEARMLAFCEQRILAAVGRERYFPCMGAVN